MSFELLKSFVTLQVRGFDESMAKLREFKKLATDIKRIKVNPSLSVSGGRGGGGGRRGAGGGGPSNLDEVRRSLGGFSTSVADAKQRFRELKAEIQADSAEIGKNITTMVRSSRSEINRFGTLLRTLFRSSVEETERLRSVFQRQIRLALFKGNIAEARKFTNELRRVEARARSTNTFIKNLSRSLAALRFAFRSLAGVAGLISNVLLGGFGGLRTAIQGAINVMGSFLIPTKAVLETMRRIVQMGPLLFSGLAISSAKGAFDTFRSFEDNLTRARANFEKLGAAGEGAYILIRDAALSVAKTTPFSAAQAAEAIDAFAKSSFNIVETLNALGPSLQFATVAKILDPAEAAKISTGVLRQFNRPVKDLDDINDAFVLAGTRSQKSIAEIAQAFEGLGSIGQEIDLPFEEALAIITRITSKNVGASESATALRIALTETLRESDKVDEALRPLGASIRDFTNASVTRFRQGGFLDFLEVIASNESAWKRFREIVGARGFRFGSATDRGSILQVRRLLEEIYQAQGTNVTERRFEAIMNTVENRFKQLQDIIKDLGIRIVNTLVDDVQDAIGDTQDLFKKLGDFADTALGRTFIKETAAGVKELALLFRPLAIAFLKLSSIANTLTFSALVSFFENTVPNLAASLNSLVATFEELTGLSFGGIESAAQSIVSLFRARGDVGKAISENIQSILDRLPRIAVVMGWEFVRAVLRGIPLIVSEVASAIDDSFTGGKFGKTTKSLAKLIYGDPSKFFESQEAFEKYMESQKASVRRFGDALKSSLPSKEEIKEPWIEASEEIRKASEEIEKLRQAQEQLILKENVDKWNAIWDAWEDAVNRAGIEGAMQEVKDAGEDFGDLEGVDFKARILGLPQLQSLLATAGQDQSIAVQQRNTDATKQNTEAINALSAKITQQQSRLEPVLAFIDRINGNDPVRVALS